MQRFVFLIVAVLWPSFSFGQTLPKVRMAYTSINIQMTPIYIMKDLDLPRQHGLDAEILMIPVSSRAIQAALAAEIQFITSGGVANIINANMSDGDFVGITSTISTFVFKIIGQPGIKEPSRLKGKKVAISRLGGASDFSLRYALDRWGLVPEKDVAIIQIGGEAEGGWRCRIKLLTRRPFLSLTTIAQREGFSVVADLSRLNAPYTLHGIGTRKSIIRDRREIVVRFMKAYVEAIHLFKTKKELALSTLRNMRAQDTALMNSTYDDYSQRLVPAVPYSTAPGIQTIILPKHGLRPRL